MKNPIFSLKKMTISLVFIGVGSLSMLSQAAVTLLVDDNIKVTAINGQELKQSVFQSLTKEFTLQPGQHVITAKYDRLYNLPRDEHDYLRSGNISVAADLADNQTYRLVMPNQPEDYAAAKRYAQRPVLAIQQHNTVIASQQSIGNNNGTIFSGLGKALGGVFSGGNDAELQNQQAIAALGQPVATTSITPTTTTRYTVPPVPVANPSQSTDTLEQFMQLWLQATPVEREKMRQWMQK